jgi:hypothetical protein
MHVTARLVRVQSGIPLVPHSQTVRLTTPTVGRPRQQASIYPLRGRYVTTSAVKTDQQRSCTSTIIHQLIGLLVRSPLRAGRISSVRGQW